jgi:hypothetical protein
MRRISSILFNPALFGFLVILAVLNLAANFIQWSGLANVDLAGVSEVVAMGFVIAVIYTAIFERKAAEP